MRSRSKDGDYTAVGGVIAPRGAGASYEFRDTGIRANEETWYRITAAESDGTESVLWTESVTYRLTFSLEQNHPNPFNPTTTIGFSLPEATQVELDIYDVSGRRVRTLVDGRREAKRYAVEWDGRDDGGTRVASGIYFYRIVAGRHVETKKMVLLK
jgi:flagellar hook assembly protein FlgD